MSCICEQKMRRMEKRETLCIVLYFLQVQIISKGASVAGIRFFGPPRRRHYLQSLQQMHAGKGVSPCLLSPILPFYFFLIMRRCGIIWFSVPAVLTITVCTKSSVQKLLSTQKGQLEWTRFALDFSPAHLALGVQSSSSLQVIFLRTIDRQSVWVRFWWNSWLENVWWPILFLRYFCFKLFNVFFNYLNIFLHYPFIFWLKQKNYVPSNHRLCWLFYTHTHLYCSKKSGDLSPLCGIYGALSKPIFPETEC